MSKFTIGFVTGTVVWFLASVYTATHVYMADTVPTEKTYTNYSKYGSGRRTDKNV